MRKLLPLLVFTAAAGCSKSPAPVPASAARVERLPNLPEVRLLIDSYFYGQNYSIARMSLTKASCQVWVRNEPVKVDATCHVSVRVARGNSPAATTTVLVGRTAGQWFIYHVQPVDENRRV